MLHAVCASILWGLFPLYFKLLKEIPSFDIVVHRLFWSCVFLVAVLAWRRQWRWVGEVIKRPMVVLGFLLSA
ncbi:EamA family transporter RarD, partial [Salmonella enterica]